MFYRNTNDSKHNNIRIASLAAALALATAAVIGGSNLLKEDSIGKSPSAVTPRVERTAPQFSTAADAVFASQGIRAPSQFGTAADAVYAAQSIRPQTASVDVNNGSHLGLGQPSVGQSFGTAADAVYASVGLAYVQRASVPDAAIDARDQSLGIGQPAVGQSFATAADAVFAAESLLAQQEVASVATSLDTSDFLGLGQPGEGTSAEPQFGTMADADYASR
ncbi:MAG TPA: hypothetical protein VFS30_16660 [Dehalococcoidia bacterium]|nr:hypothetical protein [Dehalococcoidia bacterium]